MEEENPYRSPQAQLIEPVSDDSELATREGRLGAAILDGILSFVMVTPLAYFGGYFDQIRANSEAGRLFMPFSVMALWAAIGFAVFVLVQAYPLHAYGQTWGKRVCKIKIVGTDGAKPGLGRLLLRRYLPTNAASAIPGLSLVYGWVDILMIFRRDRRCLHDLIAGTRVVRAP
ncbi:RDD family protein [Lysobacter sp. cf310]|uniref:RDD family protein n=1 Tax=Lysobacter sp. cf310 TaxID=1761790 RepID=UPI0008E549D8|nr:RDD family protein [Lysobacter sp. cf310]SFK99145.1 Uncharacterized membrane protein YckC, RDD family [Lysobacter sp. cf310]